MYVGVANKSQFTIISFHVFPFLFYVVITNWLTVTNVNFPDGN